MAREGSLPPCVKPLFVTKLKHLVQLVLKENVLEMVNKMKIVELHVE